MPAAATAIQGRKIMLIGQPAAAERVSPATAGHGVPAQPGPVVRWQVQREERAVKDTQRGARPARSHAVPAPWSSGHRDPAGRQPWSHIDPILRDDLPRSHGRTTRSASAGRLAQAGQPGLRGCISPARSKARPPSPGLSPTRPPCTACSPRSATWAWSCWRCAAPLPTPRSTAHACPGPPHQPRPADDLATSDCSMPHPPR